MAAVQVRPGSSVVQMVEPSYAYFSQLKLALTLVFVTPVKVTLYAHAQLWSVIAEKSSHILHMQERELLTDSQDQAPHKPSSP